MQEMIHGANIPESDYVLNAGSGGNTYGLKHRMHHRDIAKKKICHTTDFSVGSIESMPFNDTSFDTIVCVGSVINYCDPVATISEFSRVLKVGGTLLLEFENSHSFEYIGKDAYKRDACIIECLYQGKKHHNWVFSHAYIRQLLKYNNFVINSQKFYHVLSPLALRIGFSEDFSTKFAFFDAAARHIPLLRTHAGNVFLTCTKVS